MKSAYLNVILYIFPNTS